MGQIKNTRYNPKFKASKGGAGGVGRLIFTGNVSKTVDNKYTPGSNIGSLNTSVRRALKRRATASRGTLANPTSGAPPCCPELEYNPSNLAFP